MNNEVVYQPVQQDVIGGALSVGVYELATRRDHVVLSKPMYSVRRMRLAHIWNWNWVDEHFVPERCLMGCSVCKDVGAGAGADSDGAQN